MNDSEGNLIPGTASASDSSCMEIVRRSSGAVVTINTSNADSGDDPQQEDAVLRGRQDCLDTPPIPDRFMLAVGEHLRFRILFTRYGAVDWAFRTTGNLHSGGCNDTFRAVGTSVLLQHGQGNIEEDTGALRNTYRMHLRHGMSISRDGAINEIGGYTTSVEWTPTADAAGKRFCITFSDGVDTDAIRFDVAPAAPATLNVGIATSAGVPLSWAKPTGATGFEIHRGTSAEFTDANPLMVSVADANCADDESCAYTVPTADLSGAGDAQHYFRIRTLRTSGGVDLGTSPLSAAATQGEVVTVTRTVTVPGPAAESDSGISAPVAVALAAAAWWWGKRQATLAAGGDPAALGYLPEVSFGLDRSDSRAFFTRMAWANGSGSNWQLRSNLALHTKYSGQLLDWNANSHIGYRLNGKWGEFNPYLRGKFVQNDPENAKMLETYTLGVNYAIPNRFSAQFLQPDDEIWRYSLQTQVHLPNKMVLSFNQPNSDIWRYSANLNWRISERIGLNLSQPNNDLPNYGFGIQWRNKSKIRYEISGETGGNTYRFTGQFSF